MESTNLDWIVTDFISLMQEKEVLWNEKHPEHKQASESWAAYGEVLKSMEEKHSKYFLEASKLDTIANMKKKWKSLRQQFFESRASKEFGKWEVSS